MKVSITDFTWGIWWDISDRTFKEGYILLIHAKVGERAWYFYVKIEEGFRKAIVSPIMMSKPYDKHLVQLLTKSIVFKASDNGEFLCHPIGITYVDGDRVRYRRIADKRDVPKELVMIADTIDKYGKLVSNAGRLANAISIGLSTERTPDDLAERMVKVFIIEKIMPITKD